MSGMLHSSRSGLRLWSVAGQGMSGLKVVTRTGFVVAAGFAVQACAVPTPSYTATAPDSTTMPPTAVPTVISQDQLLAAATGELVLVREGPSGAAEMSWIDVATGATGAHWADTAPDASVASEAEEAGERFGIAIDPTTRRAAYWLWSPSPWRGQVIVRDVVAGAEPASVLAFAERAGFAGVVLPAGSDSLALASLSPDPGLVREAADSSYTFELRSAPRSPGAPVAPAEAVLWSAESLDLGADGSAIRLYAWDPTSGRAVVGFAPLQNEQGDITLIVVDVVAGAVVQTIPVAEATGLHPSPDGRWVAVGRLDGVAVMSVADGTLMLLSGTGGAAERVVWDHASTWLAWEEIAPDGSMVLLTAPATDASGDVHVLGASGGERRVVAFDPGGSLLLVARLEADGWSPRVFPVAGGPAAELDWQLPLDALPDGTFWWLAPE
jgi:hypothetical protein